MELGASPKTRTHIYAYPISSWSSESFWPQTVSSVFFQQSSPIRLSGGLIGAIDKKTGSHKADIWRERKKCAQLLPEHANIRACFFSPGPNRSYENFCSYNQHFFRLIPKKIGTNFDFDFSENRIGTHLKVHVIRGCWRFLI